MVQRVGTNEGRQHKIQQNLAGGQGAVTPTTLQTKNAPTRQHGLNKGRSFLGGYQEPADPPVLGRGRGNIAYVTPEINHQNPSIRQLTGSEPEVLPKPKVQHSANKTQQSATRGRPYQNPWSGYYLVLGCSLNPADPSQRYHQRFRDSHDETRRELHSRDVTAKSEQVDRPKDAENSTVRSQSNSIKPHLRADIPKNWPLPLFIRCL